MWTLEDSEQQEEEKKSNRERRQLSSFHLDLISEVLLRLPAKSLAKSSCVSKLWSSITTLPCFIRSFEARSSKSPCLLLLLDEGGKLFVFSLAQHQNSDKLVVVDSYVITSPERCPFLRAQSVNGLICVQESMDHPQIWNPTTRRFSTLPNPESSWRTGSVSFLGYDPIDGTLSLPCYPSNSDNQPRALTLGGGEWRVIHGLTDHAPFRSGQCINGVLYYIGSPDLSYSNIFLVRFHVRSEKLTRIDVPWKRFCLLMACEGKLVSVCPIGDDFTMWTLEDEDSEKPKWSCIHGTLPYPLRDPVLRLNLVGINDAGEFIYVPTSVGNPLYIVYFDPKGNSFRKVVVEGVADDHFRPFNGFGDKPLHIICAYPNHIESLLSAY